MALHQTGQTRQVGLEPVLLAVRAGRFLEVRDHLVDVVLELGELAGRVDGDLPGQVARGHRGGDGGDRADLGGQVGRQLVHVVGQLRPRAGHDGLPRYVAVCPANKSKKRKSRTSRPAP